MSFLIFVFGFSLLAAATTALLMGHSWLLTNQPHPQWQRLPDVIDRQRRLAHYGIELWQPIEVNQVYPDLKSRPAWMNRYGQSLLGQVTYESGIARIQIFDWLIVVKTKSNYQTFFQTVGSAELHDPGLPDFFLRPRSNSWLLSVSMPGYDDVSTDTTLTDNFRFASPLPHRAKMLIENLFARENLVGFLERQRWDVDRFGPHLTISRSGELVQPEEFPLIIADIEELIGLLKESTHAVDEYLNARVSRATAL